jgi:integrase/recombinase XerC
MMELFYSSGLRLAELANLDIRDVDFGDQLVYVTGKGNKSRVIPVGRQAIAALNDWLGKRTQWASFEQTALFVGQQGRRLGVRSIQQRLNYWGKKQGVSDRVHPHRLRHAFASHMLEASGDLRAVQELLGHADISTTQIYTHVDFQQLAKVYDSSHPRAKKGK